MQSVTRYPATWRLPPRTLSLGVHETGGTKPAVPSEGGGGTGRGTGRAGEVDVLLGWGDNYISALVRPVLKLGWLARPRIATCAGS